MVVLPINAGAILEQLAVDVGTSPHQFGPSHARMIVESGRVVDALAPFALPDGVLALFDQALAFDPKLRLASVEELQARLAAAGRRESVQQGVIDRTPTVPYAPVTPPDGFPQVTAPPADPPMTGPAPAQPGPANTPGPVPAFHSTSSPHWAPPTVRAPWMEHAGSASGVPHVLQLGEPPQAVSERRVHMVLAVHETADLVGGQAKVRVTFLTGRGGARVIHLKGLSCFVAHLGGRPSPAVTIEQPGDLALVTPRAEEIGHIRVAQGVADGTHHVFALGTAHVAIALDDCSDPILFDFGPGSDAYFVYNRGRVIPKTRRP
jgi:hypothetical protein